MKLEVGMYVRTINDKAVGNGIIGKIKYINEREHKGKLKKYYSVWIDNKNWFEILENDAISERVKASHNIIDLVQENDFVNGKLVAKNKEVITTDNIYIGRYLYEKDNSLIGGEEDIKSIVTKEQFESISYKVGD